MSEDVERVAQAIYDSGEWNSEEFWEELGESSRAMFYDAARAALAAMQPAAPPAALADFVAELRQLVALNSPENGGPYPGQAAQKCVDSMRIAADLLVELSAQLDAAKQSAVGWRRDYHSTYTALTTTSDQLRAAWSERDAALAAMQPAPPAEPAPELERSIVPERIKYRSRCRVCDKVMWPPHGWYQPASRDVWCDEHLPPEVTASVEEGR